MKFVRKLKIRRKWLNEATSSELMIQAETLWIVESQYKLIENTKFELWKRQLDLFVDSKGIWRCSGRLINTELPYSTKHPVLLPSNHHFTILVIMDCHKRVLHNGVKDTLTELRARFWVVRGRSVVKQIIRRCTICKRIEGLPYRPPKPPPLPRFRVAEEPPFTHTAVDFAGPLFLKVNKICEESKVWICLYTCCVVRAVHLDIVPNLSTEAFFRSVKRFAARKGLPRRFLSDNGKTFKSAARQ